ncbi:MAG TPA: fatty acid desaturase [Pirellulales bacterium]|jgi:fatty acid desaturase|nr:fatty acid desaturase [Pirellulales bacterium]
MLQAIRKTTDEFSVREAREIARDLFEPNPRIYWADLLVTVTIGTVCLRLLRRQPLFSPLQILGYFGAVLAFYRAGSFTHELVHLRRGTFKWFRAAWNVLVGVPLLMPSFMYYTHVAHHARNHYGTAEDGEYLPLSSGPPRNILLYMCQPLLIPIFTVARFLILAPLGWLLPGFRRFVQQRASSMVMDPRYIRPLPSNKELKVWRLQELACFLVVATGVGLFISGQLEPSLAVKFYLLAVGVGVINQLRTLGAHRFLHRGEELTFVEQLLDSVNYPEHPLLSELWAPVGLRYHALHHLFPSMPYHSLDQAHRRLMAELPEDSPYRRTNSSGLLLSIGQLWRRASSHRAG